MDAEAIAILREIRDEVRQTNSRLDQTNSRLDQTNSRLEGVETVLAELAVQQRFVVRYLKGLSERDSRLEADVIDLRNRVEVLERGRDPG